MRYISIGKAWILAITGLALCIVGVAFANGNTWQPISKMAGQNNSIAASSGGASPATLVITSTEIAGTTASPIPTTYTFSADVTGFVIGDITEGNSTIGNFAGSGAVYTADLTPTGGSCSEVTSNVALDVVDAPGKLAATQFSIITGSADVETNYWLKVADGWTDFVIFNDCSIRSYSEILNEAYANGNAEYQQAGPALTNLNGVRIEKTASVSKANGLFTATQDHTIDPGTSDFVFFVQLSHRTGSSNPQYVWDQERKWPTHSEGVAMELTSTTIEMCINDGSNDHCSVYSHGGDIWEDDTFWSVRFECDRSNTACDYYVKEAGGTASTGTATSVGTALSSMGDVSPGGNQLRFGNRRSGSFNTNITLWQWGVEVGGLTADVTTYP